MRISDFDYELPERLIAQQPLADRAASRMLVVDGAAGSFADGRFSDLPRHLRAGDVLVLNNTKVFPARLIGRSETGAAVELFLVREVDPMKWETLARPARRLRPGKRVSFGERLAATVVERNAEGRVIVEFEAVGDLYELLDRIGKTPLPPYIKRDAAGTDEDRDRYQTVFACSRGAIAAPTAGLHFTEEVFGEIKLADVEVVEITLHVGYGTFEPVRVEDLSEHKVMPERYEITAEAADLLNKAKAERRRIVAVGTTTVRTLENCIREHGEFTAGSGFADLTITPGFRFRAVDAMLTNFHLPKSSLLVLVSTFGGRELIMDAYRHAVGAGYRFYSYGDCMLIL